MKKIIACIMVCLMAFTMVFANGTKEDAAAQNTVIRLGSLKGPTGMGMAQIFCENTGDYEITLAGAIDEIVAKLTKGELDISAVPANLASVLYNKTQGGIVTLNINTLGVIYIVENGDTVHSVEDLRGKTIYASGRGATPEYGLNFILQNNGIDPVNDVDIVWKNEHTECLQAIVKSGEGIAMLPQPFVTASQLKNPQIRVALDLTAEWDKLGTDSSMVTGVTVVRKEFLEKYPVAVKNFMRDYEKSVETVTSDAAVGAKLIGEAGIFAEPVARKALPFCNIVFITGDEMKTKLSGYLAELHRQNPKAVGGKLPGDDFYADVEF